MRHESASRDIRHNFGRFVLTTIGLGLLLMLVMGMGGIYRGLVQDATLLVDRIDADLWVVQKDTRGPFAEISRVPANLEDRVRAVPGVSSSRGFVSTHDPAGTQRSAAADHGPGPVLAGGPGPVAAHRRGPAAWAGPLRDDRRRIAQAAHRREDQARQGHLHVVGHTRGMTSPAGDSMAFFTLHDAQAIQFDVSGEAVRLERSAR